MFKFTIQNSVSPYMFPAYLKAGFGRAANIIIVEWGPLSGNKAPPPIITQLALLKALPLYIQTSSNVYVVGKRVQEFISFLSSTGNLEAGPSKVHLVGQSLGAHVMGMAASNFKTDSGSFIGRVTGTDPGIFSNTKTPAFDQDKSYYISSVLYSWTTISTISTLSTSGQVRCHLCGHSTHEPRGSRLFRIFRRCRLYR
jgi:hypothetical protein